MRRMVIERSMHPQFLSNTYLVGEPGGAGFFVDAGGPVSPLIAAAERHGMTPTHVLLTHHHHDHVDELGKLTERWPDLEVLAHPDERVDGVTGEMGPDETVAVGDLEVRTLAKLAEQGIEPEKPPYTIREGGSRICFVRDPDQYRIEIIETS